jgi:hypothetical protein
MWTLERGNVYEWLDTFRRRRTILDDEKGSGRLSKSRTDDHRAEIDALIKEKSRITVREIALTVGICHGSALAIFQWWRT